LTHIEQAEESYDAMREALQLARTAIQASPEVSYHIAGNVLPAIRAALALAEGREVAK
jgi:hypothetical protein